MENLTGVTPPVRYLLCVVPCKLYFTDTKETAAQKIKKADIIYFLGGLPDRMMDRIKEFDLYDILMQHDGILMG